MNSGKKSLTTCTIYLKCFLLKLIVERGVFELTIKLCNRLDVYNISVWTLILVKSVTDDFKLMCESMLKVSPKTIIF